VILPAALLAAAVAAAPAPPGLRAATLWQAWPERRFVTAAAPCLLPGDLAARLHALEERHRGGPIRLEEAGRSVEGRPIHLLTVGRGGRRVLLWSQMHGDEPSATPALLDAVDTLLSGMPGGDAILDRLTLLLVPMLNPDGAARYARRNAQGIDVNRDALVLATPEGRLLKSIRDRFSPEIAFNLHDQDRRTAVGDTGVLASIALLAVAGDSQGTLTPGRARARRVCSLVARTVSPFVPGGVARYDEDWNPRAFGDNVTAWGTPVVLIESGGLPPDRPFTDLTRLNYVALLVVLDALARDDAAGEDPAGYEGLRRNAESLYVDVLVEGGRVAQPTAPEPYRADVAFDVLDDDRAAACRTDAAPPAAAAPAPSRVREVGDGRLLAAARRVDASGKIVAPALAVSVRGAAAGAWLDAKTLDAMARLGVGRVRWHVPLATRPRAEAGSARLAAAGRPAVEVVDLARPACPLLVTGVPQQAAGVSLGDALDALTGRRWPGRGRAVAADRLLRDLTCEAGDPRSREARAASTASPPAAPLIAPDRRASLLVLRPRPREGPPASAQESTLRPAALDVERVFVDGREPSAPPSSR
jgi:hypothetical protein